VGIDLRLLGPLRLESQGAEVLVGGQRSHRVLAVLALNANETVTTSRLIDLLWEAPPASARQQIHNTIGILRRKLQTSAGIDIGTSGVGYSLLVGEDRIDLNCFQRLVKEAGALETDGDSDAASATLAEALQLWRGTALAGLEGTYFETVRAGLEEERLSAVEKLTALRIQQGESVTVIAELTRLVASHPLREAARANLMTALDATGRQAEALAVYEQGRRMLADEHGLDPSQALKALHERILAGPAFVAASTRRHPIDEKAEAPEPARAGTPRSGSFLPHDPREFSGRAAELEKLHADSRSGAPTALAISAINGMGGIGKTALAVHFAHLIADSYPDGQFFVDLCGFAIGIEPLSPEAALRTLLMQSGVPDEAVPPDTDGRLNAWRARMAGKRALIVLDNAVDARQLRPLLLGSPGSLVLVTSRRRLPALEGLVTLPLDALPQQDAVELFTRIVGEDRTAEDPEGVAAIVELCGRLPLAVRIAAARFRERASWSVAHLRELMGDQEQRAMFLDSDEGSVHMVLALSYRQLPEKHARLFRLLSVYPGPEFDAESVALLADMTVGQARSILESLFDDNLVLEAGPGRYHLHDLVRDSAARLCVEHDTEEERRRALERLVDFTVRKAVTWCAPLARGPFRTAPDLGDGSGSIPVPEPKSATHALELLIRDATGLIEVARAALTARIPGRDWQLVCALQPYFRHVHYAAPALDLFEAALKAARRDGDERGEALCLTGTGLALRDRRRTDEARLRFEDAIQISRRRNDRSAEMYQLTDHGVVMVVEERLPEAYESFRSALTLVEGLDDPELAAALNNNLGGVCRELGRTTEGYKYLTESLKLYENAGRDQAEALTLGNLGMLLIQEHRFAEAADFLSQSKRKAQAGGHTSVEGTAEASLCVTSRAQGDLESALDHGRTALGFARRHSLPSTECDALNGLGEVHLAAGNLDAAKEAFGYAVDLTRKHGLRSYEGRGHEGAAHVHLRQGERAQAERLWHKALELHPVDGTEARIARRHLDDVSVGASCVRCVFEGGRR
jgi:DNA-binding SARP family transcriptional activator/tetratricopeptide (TPR) repeat protein